MEEREEKSGVGGKIEIEERKEKDKEEKIEKGKLVIMVRKEEDEKRKKKGNMKKEDIEMRDLDKKDVEIIIGDGIVKLGIEEIERKMKEIVDIEEKRREIDMERKKINEKRKKGNRIIEKVELRGRKGKKEKGEIEIWRDDEKIIVNGSKKIRVKVEIDEKEGE